MRDAIKRLASSSSWVAGTQELGDSKKPAERIGTAQILPSVMVARSSLRTEPQRDRKRLMVYSW